MTKIEVDFPDEYGPGTSTIGPDEHHPAADSALRWYKQWVLEDVHRYVMAREAIASTALSGNRTAEICNGTLERLKSGEPVSDRYLLGLVWTLMEMSQDEPPLYEIEASNEP